MRTHLPRHIDFIVTKINKNVGLTGKLHHSVPQPKLLNIYNSLISPYLTYGLAAWGQVCKTYLNKILRACQCKNRPLKFSWKTDCLHFFYTGQATYAMNENGLYFDLLDRFAFLIFLRNFFVGTPKTTQTGN